MKNSIRSTLNKNIVVYTTLIALLLGYFTYVTLLGLSFKIAEGIAKESSSVISTELDAIINREIYVALNLSQSKEVLAWMKDEANQDKEKEAISTLDSYLRDLRDSNIFLALDRSHHFFFFEDEVPSSLEALYVLDKKLETDSWYFNTKSYIDAYDLNVDVDRYLDTIRIWININVRDQGAFVGIVGTGIELTPILEDIIEQEANYNSETIIFDAFGAIQVSQDYKRIQENSFGSTDPDKSIYAYSQSKDFKAKVEAFMKAPQKNKVIDLDGKRQFMILSPIANTDWFMAIYYDTDEILSPKDFMPLLALTFALFFLLIVGINRLVMTRVISPIEALNKALIDKAPLASDRSDEIGNLSTSIVKMNLQLQVYSDELKNKFDIQSNLLNKVLEKAPVGVIRMDSRGRVTSSNQHFKTLMAPKQPVEFALLCHKDIDLLRTLKDQGYFNMKCTLESRPTWLALQVLVWDQEGGCDLLVTDITDKKNHEIELVKVASIDLLTGIFNRRQFEKIVAREVHINPSKGGNLSMLMFDIDHFKRVNDAFGHMAGDKVLKALANLVKANIRTGDAFARWGGEEFILLMTQTDINSALDKAEGLRKAIEDHEFSIETRITASFGVACFGAEDTYEDVFKRVDKNMYRAKENGRNRVEGP